MRHLRFTPVFLPINEPSPYLNLQHSIQIILTIISHFSHRFPIATVELGPKYLGTRLLRLFEQEPLRANAVAIAPDEVIDARFLCRHSCIPALSTSHPMSSSPKPPVRTGQACTMPVDIQCMKTELYPCG